VTFSEDICGVATQFSVMPFSDRVFVVVTQNGKLGTLIQAKPEFSPDLASNFATSILFGRRDKPALPIFASQIAEALGVTDSRPLLLGICIRDDSPAVLKAVLKAFSSRIRKPAPEGPEATDVATG